MTVFFFLPFILHCVQIKRIKANISDLFPRRFRFLHLTIMFSFLVLLPLSISHLFIFIICFSLIFTWKLFCPFSCSFPPLLQPSLVLDVFHFFFYFSGGSFFVPFLVLLLLCFSHLAPAPLRHHDLELAHVSCLKFCNFLKTINLR